jgi:cell wall-associated NlpC family hydrolase
MWLTARSVVRSGVSLGLFFVFATAPAPSFAGGVYFVKEGDTLARIGRIFGVGAEAIRSANRLASDRIAIGDRLRIPDPVAPPVPAETVAAGTREEAPRHTVDPERVRQAFCREETVYHAVAKGDTLTAIARRYQTSVDELQQLNNLRSRSRLSIGQRIVVRRSGPRTYVVRRGDSLGKIAERSRVSVADLRRFNGVQGDVLAGGQRLVLEPCDVLAAAGGVPPPLDALTANEELLAAIHEASVQPTHDATHLIAAAADLPASAATGTEATSVAQRVIDLAKTMLNIPYRFGGTTLRGIDCSAFVQRVFGLIDLELPRTAREQFSQGERIDRGQLSVGDLVFFRTYASFPSHVGIYLGDDLFIHASSVGRKVTIDSLEQGYYRKRFLGGRRVIEASASTLAAAP